MAPEWGELWYRQEADAIEGNAEAAWQEGNIPHHLAQADRDWDYANLPPEWQQLTAHARASLGRRFARCTEGLEKTRDPTDKTYAYISLGEGGPDDRKTVQVKTARLSMAKGSTRWGANFAGFGSAEVVLLAFILPGLVCLWELKEEVKQKRKSLRLSAPADVHALSSAWDDHIVPQLREVAIHRAELPLKDPLWALDSELHGILRKALSKYESQSLPDASTEDAKDTMEDAKDTVEDAKDTVQAAKVTIEDVKATEQGSVLRRGKTVEEIYRKKTQHEHILLRPDTYVGSTEQQSQEMWVFDETTQEMVFRCIEYVPALYKIFDEILVNAADNLKRDPEGMDRIEVEINPQEGYVSIMNNGSGVPVQVHQEYNVYVPDLIFGQLLTSDNYDDSEKKVTGGRNGYGAKLTNVFSTKFIVETADSDVKQKYRQVFENNMTEKEQPELEDYDGADFTRITFYPDLRRFAMEALDDDIVSLMKKRVYDIAGSTDERCKVFLNGEELKVGSFLDYVKMYLPQRKTEDEDEDEEPTPPFVYARTHERWEVAMSVTDGTFQQVSFVNSICTTKGGTHVKDVTDQLVNVILKEVNRQNTSGILVKPQMAKNHLSVFVNCAIENPAFDSQTKENLTLKPSLFGSRFKITDEMKQEVLTSGVVQAILDWVNVKEQVDLEKLMRVPRVSSSSRIPLPKLEEANWAGGKRSKECTLILTEGDSAKALAVAGLSVVGRDAYGVFPLKGKLLNVRKGGWRKAATNEEIKNLMQIIGLEPKKVYTSTEELRYGSVMIMTDQDHDGSHIKGLLINLLEYFWPSLLELGFLKEFVTPIVKVWKGNGKPRSFFTMEEYRRWREKPEHKKGWKMKYYKGLGTNTAKEAKQYFEDIDKHVLDFEWVGDKGSELIDLAFNQEPGRSHDRKAWINGADDEAYVDHSESTLTYDNFVNKELVHFAKYGLTRAIPSMVDGLKPSQRKVMYCAFKRNLKSDIKVAQLVGYVSEQAAYHHGEKSLEMTIVKLAQTFVGSNNINLLVPSGQFGTRAQGGSDSAAARYIYTRLNKITRDIFHEDDDLVLKQLEDEGQLIEPQWYCPIIPMVLVNGTQGIGVGWSTSIPNYNPMDIIRNLRRLLRGLPMEEMIPWYRGYRGEISRDETGASRYDVVGKIEQQQNNQTYEITELPVKVWTQNYKETLEGMLRQASANGNGVLDDFREYHTENTVHFSVKLARDSKEKVEKQGLEKVFKLRSSLSTSNMMLFDASGKIVKYESALEILEEFAALRRQVYVNRKEYLVAKLRREREELSNKARFILMVVGGELELRKRKQTALLAELRRLKFTPMSELKAMMKTDFRDSSADGEAADREDEEASAADAAANVNPDHDYDYLLKMNLLSLTYEKVEELKKELEVKNVELDNLVATTIEMMWDSELATLSEKLGELEAEELKSVAQEANKRKRAPREEPSSSKVLARAVPPRPASTPHATTAALSKADLARPLQDCEINLRDKMVSLKAVRAARAAGVEVEEELQEPQQQTATRLPPGKKSAAVTEVGVPAVSSEAAARQPALVSLDDDSEVPLNALGSYQGGSVTSASESATAPPAPEEVRRVLPVARSGGSDLSLNMLGGQATSSLRGTTVAGRAGSHNVMGSRNRAFPSLQALPVAPSPGGLASVGSGGQRAAASSIASQLRAAGLAAGFSAGAAVDSPMKEVSAGIWISRPPTAAAAGVSPHGPGVPAPASAVPPPAIDLQSPERTGTEDVVELMQLSPRTALSSLPANPAPQQEGAPVRKRRRISIVDLDD
eukprot:CAMPEP_0178416360 /NCGR_PEP_ID=MMETSP0689_2-20121128/24024_1 /TAXON_ID=160604 /ORGANISM="Amphidinium massartii, Strain CS-259" /LENGTH=1782 /DNA_ID=CAMNT_0020037703 /DNA_START=34 /DNA_END=5380 /DNA_ORIENTATION=+